MDTLHQQQEMSCNSNTLENMLTCSKEKKPKPQQPQPQPEHAQKCPRCESTNTKFCYYNNYSLSQPRYFCKSCRRYWTKGGTLRNVPVGGGCRKNNKRPSSSKRSQPQFQSQFQSQDHQQPLQITTNQNPLLSSYDSNDLTLAFAKLQKQNMGFEFDHHDHISNQGGSFLDALRFGYLETQNQNQNQNPTNFQTLCYGYARNVDLGNGSGSFGGDCNGNGNGDQVSDHQSKNLWGLPWQINGDQIQSQSIDFNNMSSEVDSARESWNGFASSWHGLLNSPLM